MSSPPTHPDINDPIWSDVMIGSAEVMSRHPDHCAICAEARMTTERELRILQDGACADCLQLRTQGTTCDDCLQLRPIIQEVIETFRGSRHPMLRVVVTTLSRALKELKR